jgi:hypothetical protein
MLVRVALGVIAASAVFASQVLASAQIDAESANAEPIVASAALDDQTVSETHKTEERALADLAAGMTAFVLSSTQSRTDIAFTLPPTADATEAWLRLAARPASDTTNGRIHVSLNGGEAITIRPEPRALEARFALFSDDIRAGENTLSITYSSDSAAAGWIVDARRSQLRLSLDSQGPIDGLAGLEEALAADFAAPRRIALVSDVSRERVTLESLVVQGIALRAGAVPLFTADADNADLVIRIAENSRLTADDRTSLKNGDRSQGPELAFTAGTQPRLVITGRNIDETTAAARLFAARSLAGYERSFLASDALSARRLGQRLIRDSRQEIEDADLRTFASSGMPFSADQGSRTAVQFSTSTEADRFGALSVVARAALISGEAWLFAWYGDANQQAPADHNLLVIGPGSTNVAALDRNAPAEMRAAMRAAERSQGQRGLMRLAAAAYAADSENPTRATDGTDIGVASLFRDQDVNGRWIGTLTATEAAGFEAAGRSLARSDLWGALEGRAAVWSARGVTPMDYSVNAPSLVSRVREFLLDHLRDAAFLLFGCALLLLARGILGRRRRVHAT